MSPGRREGGKRRANCVSMVGRLTAIQRSRPSFSAARAARTKGAPEGGTGERRLGAGTQLLAVVAPCLLGEQALKRVLQVPFALLQLGVWPARLDRPQHSAVVVTDDPPWLAG